MALLYVFQSVSDSLIEPKSHPLREQQQTVNPKTGKTECVFVNLEAVYPNISDPMAAEFSFEELRARHRGWMEYDWAAIRKKEEMKKSQVDAENRRHDKQSITKEPKQRAGSATDKSRREGPVQALTAGIEENLVLNDENTPPSQTEIEKVNLAKKIRREERANRTRKIKVMEVRAATQTGR